MSLNVKAIAAGYGDRSIVDEISFAIEPGKIMALFGHNGAGKSTVLKALLGLIDVSSGAIELDGQRIEKLSIDARLGRGLRLLPEGRGVFPELTVDENLKVVANANAGATMKVTPADVLKLFPVIRGIWIKGFFEFQPCANFCGVAFYAVDRCARCYV